MQNTGPKAKFLDPYAVPCVSTDWPPAALVCWNATWLAPHILLPSPSLNKPQTNKNDQVSTSSN